MPYTPADVLSGRVTLPEPFASIWRAGGPDATAALVHGLAALEAREQAQEKAAESEAKLKAQIEPLREAAKKLADSPVPAPPKLLASLAAWGSIALVGFSLWRWWRSRRKKAKAA